MRARGRDRGGGGGCCARVEARARVKLERSGAETMCHFARDVFARRRRRERAASTAKGTRSRGGWQALNAPGVERARDDEMKRD